jgi:long-chain fatty acid transport protein
MNRTLTLSTLALAGALFRPALATNGMNLIGYGAASALMAGGRMGNANPTAMVGNPALLADIDRPMLCTSLSLLMPSLTYTDHVPTGMGAPNEGAVMNDAVEGESSVFPLPFVGYAKPISEKMVVGVCGYAQGGMGVDFKGLNTAFGTRDDLYSNIAYMRLTGGFSYRAGTKSAVGLSVSVGYAALEFDYFPHTVVDMNGDMVPEFNGMSATDLTSFGYNARLGFSSRAVQDRLLWGAWFGTKAAVSFDGGTLTFAAPMPDGSNGFDAQFKDFSWPAEIGVGFAWEATKRWTLLSDMVHYGWRDAVDEPYLKTDVGMINAMLPPFRMHWRNRTAVSVSSMVRLTEDLTLLAGYNHGASPVPSAALNGLFPATVEDHFSLGAKVVLGDWAVLGGAEVAPQASQTNEAPDDPTDYFGMTNTTIDHSQLSIHLGLSREF